MLVGTVQRFSRTRSFHTFGLDASGCGRVEPASSGRCLVFIVLYALRQWRRGKIALNYNTTKIERKRKKKKREKKSKKNEKIGKE